ncbi:Sec63 Brl domain-containing protein [Fusarium flagelliforme]|uniref:Sec63 Brl domain-containing protein n=1 Tax=Fusarium flagelliforme TaxID=2675880 RepID=UPI001E8E8E3D|nr:Sec63 Brl domain-containing protein [Fusarium flagelliforme]KAH7179375.1 Sec63 Brl domain-containing protein [Fusarium flagelliforme]
MPLALAEPQKAASNSQSSTSRPSHKLQRRYELAASTFKILCEIKRKPDIFAILKIACSATEFNTFSIRKEETAFFRAINDSTGIPYQVPEFISKPWHKAFLLVQIDLLKTGWPNKLKGAARKELYHELPRMYKLLDRVLRCLVDILGERGDGRGVQTALEVLRSVKSGVWEKSDNHLLQVEGIGPAKKDRLVKANIKTIKDLSTMEFYHIERILSRNPPFGQTLLHKVAGFPILKLDFEIIGQYTPEAEAPLPVTPVASENNQAGTGVVSASESLWIARAVLGFANGRTPSWKGRTPWLTLVVEGGDGRLVWFWRGSAKRLVDEKEMIIGLSAKSGEQLKVAFSCEEIVGTMVQMDVRVDALTLQWLATPSRESSSTNSSTQRAYEPVVNSTSPPLNA